MPGLIESLDTTFDGSGLTASVNGQADFLNRIGDAVKALTDGPDVLTNLQHALGGLPLPRSLDGITALPGQLGGITSALPGSIAGGTDGPLGPLLAPLARLGDLGATVRVIGSVSAGVELIQAVLELVTRRMFSGAHPFPAADPSGATAVAANAWRRQPMAGSGLDLTSVRARIAEVDGLLAGFGTGIDAGKLVDLLRRAGGVFAAVHKWPPIPVVAETAEVLATIATWSSLTPAQLTDELRRHLARIATLVATPRDRVAAPVIQQAQTAAAARATMTTALSSLAGPLEQVRRKVTETFAQPSPGELASIEAPLAELEAMAAALAIDGTPLGRLDGLPRALELELMRVIRTVLPAYDPSIVTRYVQRLVAFIPAADPDPLAPLVAQVQGVDLSFLSGPIAAIREQVQGVVDDMHSAMDSVRDALTHLLQPVADAMDSVKDAVHLDDIRAALESLPATIQHFIDDTVKPAIEPVRQAISQAVTLVSSAADDFDPETLIVPIRKAILQVTAVLRSDEVKDAFGTVQTALSQATEVLGSFSLAPAADEAISALGQVEQKLAAIDPTSIPDAAKPILKGAIEVVAHIDFTHDVAAPLVEDAKRALEKGPEELLKQLQDLLDDLKERVERFRPSVVVGVALDAPFADLIRTLDGFRPSALLDGLDHALASALDQVHLVDPTPILAPLQSLYQQMIDGAAALRPSNLVRPLEDEIEKGVNKLFEITGVDDAFAAIDQVLQPVRDLLDLLGDTRAALSRASAFLANPPAIETALDQLVDGALAKLDGADVGALHGVFGAIAEAAAAIEQPRLAGDLAHALQAAGEQTPASLTSPEAERLKVLVRAFPLEQLRASRQTPARARLVDQVQRLRGVADRLDAAAAPWQGLGTTLRALAPDLQNRLVTYARLMRMNGRPIFADFAAPPADTAALKENIRGAMRDGLRLPVTALYGVLAAVAPHVAGLFKGLGDLIGAVRQKLDALVGDQGVGGIANALEEVADLLRHFDLSPLTDPLDALYGRIESALTILNPAPLGAALTAAVDAVSGLARISTLIGADDVTALDHAYAEALDKLRALSPSAIVAAALDPVFEEQLADVLPLFELPDRLRALVSGAGAHLGDEVNQELERVEVAFDRMLHAIPLDGGGGGGASGSISVSASANAA